jgi:MFS family permease
MGYLIALGLLIAFSAALLSRYGRRLLLTMCVVVAIPCAILALVIAYYNAHPHPDSSATAFPSTDASLTISSAAEQAAPLGSSPAPIPVASATVEQSQADEDRANLAADERSGLVQWIGGKMYYCSKNYSWPSSRPPRPQDLCDPNKAPPSAGPTASAAETVVPDSE